MTDSERLVRRLLDTAGTTFADESGIRLKNEPMPLFQLLTLTMLASKPIDAGIATRAAREVFDAGIRTPAAVLDADRRDLIDALGRAGYTRYDDSSVTRLSEMATMVRNSYGGDLRQLAAESKEDVGETVRKLHGFKGIGDTGSSIFLREVQDVWPWVRPYFDERALSAARDLGLPTTPGELGKLAPRSTARLAAALARVSLNPDLLDNVTGPPAKT